MLKGNLITGATPKEIIAAALRGVKGGAGRLNPRCAKSVPRQANAARQSLDRVDTNQPLNWAFQDAMAPCETRCTVGLGFTHQRRDGWDAPSTAAATITKPLLILYQAAPHLARHSATKSTNSVNAQTNSIHPADL